LGNVQTFKPLNIQTVPNTITNYDHDYDHDDDYEHEHSGWERASSLEPLASITSTITNYDHDYEHEIRFPKSDVRIPMSESHGEGTDDGEDETYR